MKIPTLQYTTDLLTRRFRRPPVFRSLARRALAAKMGLYALTFTSMFAIIHLAFDLRTLHSHPAGKLIPSHMLSQTILTEALNSLAFAIAVALFIPWILRAVANLRCLGHPNPDPDPLKSAIGWFIPFYNVLLSRRIISQLWRHSDPDAGAPPDIANLWWASWLCASVMHLLLTFAPTPFDAAAAPRNQSLEYTYMALAAHLITIVATTTMTLLITRISDNQHRKSAATPAAGPRPDGAPMTLIATLTGLIRSRMAPPEDPTLREQRLRRQHVSTAVQNALMSPAMARMRALWTPVHDRPPSNLTGKNAPALAVVNIPTWPPSRSHIPAVRFLDLEQLARGNPQWLRKKTNLACPVTGTQPHEASLFTVEPYPQLKILCLAPRNWADCYPPADSPLHNHAAPARDCLHTTLASLGAPLRTLIPTSPQALGL